MSVNKDFEELIHCLNDAGVKFLIVGAYAVIYYTEPRYTKDLDVWVSTDSANAKNVYDALKAFGAPLTDLSPEDLGNPEMVYQIGIEPNRIDILMGIEGVDFDGAWNKRQKDIYGKEDISIIDIENLIRSKKTANRDQDKIDVKNLESALKEK
jgi:predicted nucleotidyltransferase